MVSTSQDHCEALRSEYRQTPRTLPGTECSVCAGCLRVGHTGTESLDLELDNNSTMWRM